MSDNPAIVWLVGSKKSDAREYRELLEASDNLQVAVVALRPRVEDYADLAANSDTGAIILSDSIRRRSDKAYSSGDVAAYLRALRAQLPIFVLSEDDAAEDDPAVDAIFAARDLRKRPEAYTTRLMRAIGRYQDAMSAHQQRLQALLDRQIAGALTAEEAEELARLRSSSERAAQVKVAKQAESQEVDLLEKRELVSQLEALATKLEGRRRGAP
jgi:hypothetical protein